MRTYCPAGTVITSSSAVPLALAAATAPRSEQVTALQTVPSSGVLTVNVAARAARREERDGDQRECEPSDQGADGNHRRPRSCGRPTASWPVRRRACPCGRGSSSSASRSPRPGRCPRHPRGRRRAGVLDEPLRAADRGGAVVALGPELALAVAPQLAALGLLGRGARAAPLAFLQSSGSLRVSVVTSRVCETLKMPSKNLALSPWDVVIVTSPFLRVDLRPVRRRPRPRAARTCRCA